MLAAQHLRQAHPVRAVQHRFRLLVRRRAALRSRSTASAGAKVPQCGLRLRPGLPVRRRRVRPRFGACTGKGTSASRAATTPTAATRTPRWSAPPRCAASGRAWTRGSPSRCTAENAAEVCPKSPSGLVGEYVCVEQNTSGDCVDSRCYLPSRRLVPGDPDLQGRHLLVTAPAGRRNGRVAPPRLALREGDVRLRGTARGTPAQARRPERERAPAGDAALAG